VVPSAFDVSVINKELCQVSYEHCYEFTKFKRVDNYELLGHSTAYGRPSVAFTRRARSFTVFSVFPIYPDIRSDLCCKRSVIVLGKGICHAIFVNRQSKLNFFSLKNARCKRLTIFVLLIKKLYATVVCPQDPLSQCKRTMKHATTCEEWVYGATSLDIHEGNENSNFVRKSKGIIWKVYYCFNYL